MQRVSILVSGSPPAHHLSYPSVRLSHNKVSLCPNKSALGYVCYSLLWSPYQWLRGRSCYSDIHKDTQEPISLFNSNYLFVLWKDFFRTRLAEPVRFLIHINFGKARTTIPSWLPICNLKVWFVSDALKMVCILSILTHLIIICSLLCISIQRFLSLDLRTLRSLLILSILLLEYQSIRG